MHSSGILPTKYQYRLFDMKYHSYIYIGFTLEISRIKEQNTYYQYRIILAKYKNLNVGAIFHSHIANIGIYFNITISNIGEYVANSNNVNIALFLG